MKIPGKIIRNFEFPPCKNCVFYRLNGFDNEFTSSLNKCEKFGTMNIVTGKITHDYADSCRSDENRCGKSGKYHVKEPRMALKRLKHTIFRPVSIFYGILVLYLVIFYGMYIVK